MEAPFTLGGATTTLTPTTSSDVDTFTPSYGRIRVYNAGPNIAFLSSGIGTFTAAVTGCPLAAGAIETFSVPANHTYVGAICATGSATVYVTVGAGS